MSGIPTKLFWQGEDVESLPREKLIEIIRHLANDLERTRQIGISSARMLGTLVRHN